MDQKIKNDYNICIGYNIRSIRKAQHIKQVELVKELQLRGVPITRETLVKIEGGRHHISASHLCIIRDILGVTLDDLFQNMPEIT